MIFLIQLHIRMGSTQTPDSITVTTMSSPLKQQTMLLEAQVMMEHKFL